MKRMLVNKTLCAMLVSSMMMVVVSAVEITREKPVMAAETGTEDDTYADYSEYLDNENWSKYSCDYFYNQMNANEKELYRGLSVAAQKAMDSDEDISRIEAEYHDMSLEEYTKVEQIWLENEAQYFFICGYGGEFGRSGTAHMVVLPEFESGAARQAAKKKYTETIYSILREANKGKNDIEKEKIIHDTLVKRLNYGRSENQFEDQTAASSLIGKTTVCGGYAAAFSVLMNGIGIPTISVTTVGHEWNKVQLNGKWYNVDVTFDDLGFNNDFPDGRNMTYEFFNVSDQSANSKDTGYNTGDHIVSSMWQEYNVPTCNSDDIHIISLQGGKNSMTVNKGEYADVYLTTNYPRDSFTLRSSNKKIVRTDRWGNIRGVKKGKAYVTAHVKFTDGSKEKYKLMVTVR